MFCFVFVVVVVVGWVFFCAFFSLCVCVCVCVCMMGAGGEGGVVFVMGQRLKLGSSVARTKMIYHKVNFIIYHKNVKNPLLSLQTNIKEDYI